LLFPGYFLLDISGLPEPVQLALKVIELEGSIEDCDQKTQSQETTITTLKNQLEKIERDHKFQVSALKKENQFLKEKLEYKATLEVSTKGRMKSKKGEIKSFKEELETVRNLCFFCF